MPLPPGSTQDITNDSRDLSGCDSVSKEHRQPNREPLGVQHGKDEYNSSFFSLCQVQMNYSSQRTVPFCLKQYQIFQEQRQFDLMLGQGFGIWWCHSTFDSLQVMGWLVLSGLIFSLYKMGTKNTPFRRFQGNDLRVFFDCCVIQVGGNEYVRIFGKRSDKYKLCYFLGSLEKLWNEFWTQNQNHLKVCLLEKS